MSGCQHLVWIGSMVPEDFYNKLCTMGYRNQQASRIAQENIIHGLEHHYGTTFDYVSGPALPAYPKFPELRIKPFAWDTPNGGHGEYASYINIEYINRLFKSFGMKRAAGKLVDRYADDDGITVFVNSPHTPFIQAGLKIKKKNPNAKLVLIVPDLPQYMQSKPSLFKRLLKTADIAMMNIMIKKFDYYVLYTEKMQQFLGLPIEKCVTMEGCASPDECVYQKKDMPHPFTFMYSGTADKRFGLNMLVDAFSQIQGDCRLIITGKGDAANYIKSAAEKDTRIQYFGFVDDYSKVKQMQADADIMMNMRLPSEPASDYCFPSKLFEYMKTGNPVISFRIGGIPEEYYEHLLVVDNESSDSLKAVMKASMAISEQDRQKFGVEAKNFVLEKKNVISQTKLIYELVG